LFVATAISHVCHVIADRRKLKLCCLSGIKGLKIHMNFHENCPAGSEDSIVIQHYTVLTVVMFCISFFVS
jgi:hypothetical protein